MVVMNRRASSTLTAVYWVALPLSALVAVSLAILQFMPTVERTGSIPAWALPLAVLIPLLLIWRLRVHERARRTAPDTVPSDEGSETPQ